MKIKRISNIILYVPEGPLGRVFKKVGITATILFIPNNLGIGLISWGPSPFVY